MYTVTCTELLDGETEPRIIARRDFATPGRAAAEFKATVNSAARQGYFIKAGADASTEAFFMFGTTIRHLTLAAS